MSRQIVSTRSFRAAVRQGSAPARRAMVAAATTAGICLGLLCPGLGAGRAAAAERTVLAIVACDSYADLKKQFGWLGTQVGQPGLAGMLESVLLMATQGRGLGGLDVKRPLGVVVTTGGDDVAVHGFLPVRGIDKLLESLQAVTGPVERQGDTRSLVLPSGIALDIVERNGWAVVSQQGVPVEAIDPAPLLEPLVKNYTLGIELFPHRMPEILRLQLRILLEQAAAAAGEQAAGFDPRQLADVLDGLGDAESLALGLAIDADKNRFFLETRATAVPGSPAAQAMQGSDQGESTVPLPTAADGGRPVVRVHVVQAVPESARAQALAMLDMILPPGGADPLAATIGLLVREASQAILDSGAIDAAATIDTSAGNARQGGRVLPVVTAGIRVKDGAALEARVKETFGGGKKAGAALPRGVKVAFDSGNVGGVKLHTLTVDLKGTEAADMLGESLDLTLAFAPRHAFLMFGGDPRGRLAPLLAADAAGDPQAKPFVGVDVAVGRLPQFLGNQFPAAAEAGGTTGDDDGARDGGHVRLLVRPIERGVAMRLAVDGQAIGTAMAAGAAAGAAGGGLPPGLPVPNGFPLPIPVP